MDKDKSISLWISSWVFGDVLCMKSIVFITSICGRAIWLNPSFFPMGVKFENSYLGLKYVYLIIFADNKKIGHDS